MFERFRDYIKKIYHYQELLNLLKTVLLVSITLIEYELLEFLEESFIIFLVCYFYLVALYDNVVSQ